MSYVVGTDLGRLRELIGDTSDDDEELFADEFLEALLDDFSVGRSAVIVLTRLSNDPRMLMRHFRGLGVLGLNELSTLQRMVREQIDWIEKSYLAPKDTPTNDERFPEADQTAIGRATDENGFWEGSTVDNYILELEQRE